MIKKVFLLLLILLALLTIYQFLLKKPLLNYLDNKARQKILTLEQLKKYDDEFQVATKTGNMNYKYRNGFPSGTKILGRDPRNNMVVVRESFCGDNCIKASSVDLVYENVSEEECTKIGGKTSYNFTGWVDVPYCAVLVE